MTIATTTSIRCTFEDFKASRHRTATALTQYGGNFARHLAGALVAADPNNLRILYESFPHILTPYEPGGRFHNV